MDKLQSRYFEKWVPWSSYFVSVFCNTSFIVFQMQIIKATHIKNYLIQYLSYSECFSCIDILVDSTIHYLFLVETLINWSYFSRSQWDGRGKESRKDSMRKLALCTPEKRPLQETEKRITCLKAVHPGGKFWENRDRLYRHVFCIDRESIQKGL